MVLTVENPAVISIQCDWDSELRSPGNHVWISFKFKDSVSVHGKIKSMSGDSLTCRSTTDDFLVQSSSQTHLEVAVPSLGQTTLFLAPITTYSGIHSKSINSLDVTSTGLAVSSTSNNDLIVWDVLQDEKKLRLDGHKGDVYRCKFFPSEKVILSCGGDMRLRIWCAETGRCPVTLAAHTQAVTHFAIVEKGKNVISVSKDGLAKLWHCANAECISDLIKVPSVINYCSLHTSVNLPESAKTSTKEVGTKNKILLIGCEDGMVYCIAVQSKTLMYSYLSPSPVNCLAFISEYCFVLGCQSGQVIVVDVDEWKPQLKEVWYDCNSAVLALFPYKEGLFIARADGSLTFRLMSNNSKTLSLTGPNCDPVYDIAFDGTHLFTCCRDAVIRQYYPQNALNKLFGL